jgi:hypothetical protein
LSSLSAGLAKGRGAAAREHDERTTAGGVGADGSPWTHGQGGQGGNGGPG